MKFARKTDILIIAILAAAGLLLWILFNVLGRSGAVAEIYVKSELVKTVALSSGKDESFTLASFPNVVFHLYDDGSLAFIKSDCPDKTCIQAGRLHLTGQYAACLPNQVYVKIIGAGKAVPGAPDIIIG